MVENIQKLISLDWIERFRSFQVLWIAYFLNFRPSNLRVLILSKNFFCVLCVFGGQNQTSHDQQPPSQIVHRILKTPGQPTTPTNLSEIIAFTSTALAIPFRRKSPPPEIIFIFDPGIKIRKKLQRSMKTTKPNSAKFLRPKAATSQGDTHVLVRPASGSSASSEKSRSSRQNPSDIIEANSPPTGGQPMDTEGQHIIAEDPTPQGYKVEITPPRSFSSNQNQHLLDLLNTSAEPSFKSETGSQDAYDEFDTELPLADTMSFYESSHLETAFLLVSFIPIHITWESFADLMDAIQETLCMSETSDYYRGADYAELFGDAPIYPWYRDGFHYQDENHGSFILELPYAITFGHLGRLRTHLPPMVFTIVFPIPHLHGQDPKPRRILVQPTVDLMSSGLLLPPMAVWRGLGTDKAGGHPAAMLALIKQHVDRTFEAVRDHGSEQEPFTWHTYLSLHHINITPSSLPQQGKTAATKGTRLPPGPVVKRSKTATGSATPAVTPHTIRRFSYIEYFAFTVCSASIPTVQECFAALFPGGRLDSTAGVVSFPGWTGQIATDLAMFRTLAGAVPPAIELLLPQPVTIIPNVTTGTPPTTILDALEESHQDTSAIHYAYLQRGDNPANDSCVLITNGHRYRMTTHLRHCSTGTPQYFDDLDDLKSLRQYYAWIRLALGCTNPPPKTRPSGPSTLMVRAQPTTYAQATRDGPGQTLSLSLSTFRSQITKEINQRVEEAHNHLQTTVESTLATQSASIQALQDQLTLQTQTANEALLRATKLQTQYEEQLTTQTTLRGMIELSLAALHAMSPAGPAIPIHTYGAAPPPLPTEGDPQLQPLTPSPSP